MSKVHSYASNDDRYIKDEWLEGGSGYRRNWGTISRWTSLCKPAKHIYIKPGNKKVTCKVCLKLRNKK